MPTHHALSLVRSGFMLATVGLGCLRPPAASVHAEQTSAEKTAQTIRASGTFDVALKPLALDDKAGDGVSTRMSSDKQIHGDLEGTSKGQMLAASTPVEGSGAYVAIERISGTLKGRTGTFVLQHSGWMTKAGMHMQITVVPDSGTGQLTGLAGTFTIKIVGDKHFYDFDYTLPAR